MDNETPQEIDEMDYVDEENVSAEIKKTLGQYQSYLAKLENFRFYSLIYRLVRDGGISQAEVARHARVSRQWVDIIVNRFEEWLPKT